MSLTALEIFVNQIPPAGSGCVCTHLPYIGKTPFGFQDTFVNFLPIGFFVILKVVRAHQGTG